MRNQAIDDCIRRLAVIQEHLRHAGMHQALQHVSTAISELKLAFPGSDRRESSHKGGPRARSEEDSHSGGQCG